MLILTCLQVKKIAPVFQVKASTIYLVREFEIVAVFPHEASGRFNRGLIDATAVYAVHGDDATTSPQQTHMSPASVPVTPFGAYTGPTVSVPARTMLSKRGQSNSFRKSISLVSISSDYNKPSTSKGSGIQYEIITQLVVILEVGQCSIATVAESIRQQVSYPVVLLDSKGYRIIESSTTKTAEFGRVTVKFLLHLNHHIISCKEPQVNLSLVLILQWKKIHLDLSDCD